MYVEYYAKDPNFLINEKDAAIISAFTEQYVNRIKWDKIFVLPPHREFVDDHVRFMGHASLEVRNELYQILIKDLEKYGLMDKVVILNGSYYENFLAVSNYIKDEILHEI